MAERVFVSLPTYPDLQRRRKQNVVGEQAAGFKRYGPHFETIKNESLSWYWLMYGANSRVHLHIGIDNQNYIWKPNCLDM